MTIQDQTDVQLELALPIPSHQKPLRASPAKADEPVFVRHPHVINHPPEAWRHVVPWPYRIKWDGGWLFVAFLFAGGFAFKLLWVLAAFIAFLRVVIWCSFRFPLTTFFFTSLIRSLMGGHRRRRW